MQSIAVIFGDNDLGHTFRPLFDAAAEHPAAKQTVKQTVKKPQKRKARQHDKALAKDEK
jgi:hypothetical protein